MQEHPFLKQQFNNIFISFYFEKNSPRFFQKTRRSGLIGNIRAHRGNGFLEWINPDLYVGFLVKVNH